MYRVVFPFELKLCNTSEGCDAADSVYNLFAVVVHIGSGMNHGEANWVSVHCIRDSDCIFTLCLLCVGVVYMMLVTSLHMMHNYCENGTCNGLPAAVLPPCRVKQHTHTADTLFVAMQGTM